MLLTLEEAKDLGKLEIEVLAVLSKSPEEWFKTREVAKKIFRCDVSARETLKSLHRKRYIDRRKLKGHWGSYCYRIKQNLQHIYK